MKLPITFPFKSIIEISASGFSLQIKFKTLLAGLGYTVTFCELPNCTIPFTKVITTLSLTYLQPLVSATDTV